MLLNINDEIIVNEDEIIFINKIEEEKKLVIMFKNNHIIMITFNDKNLPITRYITTVKE